VRAVVQRVSRAVVRVDRRVVGEIGQGLLVLVGVRLGDTGGQAEALADKVAHLRVFPDDDGKMNRSVLDEEGAVLVVSQFTLYGDTRRGRRPSFVDAAPPEEAEPFVGMVAAQLGELGVTTATGEFGAHMEVELTNDGPVTILIET
jgi:D-tyrosyl-tRNA(Tyr) deacylase